jgi:hypothetical protein
MSNKEIQNIRGKILATELEISLIDNEIKRLELEKTYFSAMIESREANIEILKKREIICTIKGYKQSKEDLVFFKEKLINIDNYIDKKRKEMDNIEKIYNFHLGRFDELWVIMKNEVKVLKFIRKEV